MTRRQRLMATLRGEPVDRPAVSFYEIDGLGGIDPSDPDEFNVYNDPSWLPLLRLAEEQTDLIRMVSPGLAPAPNGCRDEFFRTETWTEGRSRFSRTTLTIKGRTMTEVTRRDSAINTIWTLEHLLKDLDDLKAYLELPYEALGVEVDVSPLPAAEERVGQKGIVMVDTGDPICWAAQLFSMADYTVVALSEQKLFHRLLEKVARGVHDRTEKVARAFPGHLWRICGPEFAGEPYLPPRLFEEYVVRYTQPMIQAIHRYGGYARIHMHGRIRSALPMILTMGADATDPIEPPPLGNVTLKEVRSRYGKDLVLFGNIETRDIENMAPDEFEKVVAKSLQDGTAGEGRGFVLMPSACPVGRSIAARTMKNYETIARLATAFTG